MKNSKNNLKDDIVNYLQFIENNPEEKKKLNSAINREVKKLQKNKENEFTAMFLSSIKF